MEQNSQPRETGAFETEKRELTSPETPELGTETSVRKKPWTSRKKHIVLICLLIAMLVSGALVFTFGINRFSLEIRMEGKPEFLQEVGQPYVDPGASVIFRGSLLIPEGMMPEGAALTVESDVREDTLGKYTVTYRATFLGWEATAVRNVRVADIRCPVITLVETGETILPGEQYEEEGFSAWDNYDGDITDKVRRTEDMGVITYSVMDSSGNPAYVERRIPYYDPIPPEIHLEGGAAVTIPSGTIYADPGYAATDNADGDITPLVETEGEVLWYQPGTYEVVYSVTDSYGNTTKATRCVEVTAQPRPEVVYPPSKTIYLTFDDGPGPYTGWLLDILRHYGVKATFFVVDSGYDAMMERIVREGHSIGIHSVSHQYQSIYASPEAFFEDLYGMQDIIYRNTGVKTTLMRFPGGGSNEVSRFNRGIMTTLTEAVQDAGFQYFDWNVDSLDAGGAKNKKEVLANVASGAYSKYVSVVLQHDTHAFSVEAVEDIICWGLDNGYTFLPLSPDSPGVHHTVMN